MHASSESLHEQSQQNAAAYSYSYDGGVKAGGGASSKHTSSQPNSKIQVYNNTTGNNQAPSYAAAGSRQQSANQDIESAMKQQDVLSVS